MAARVGTPHRSASNAGPHLVAEDLKDFRPRSGENNLFLGAPAREVGVLAQEAVARMDRIAARLLRNLQDLFDIEIGRRANAAQLPRFIGLDRMQRTGVILRKDRHRAYPKFGGGADNADRNFPPIGDQKAFRNHRLNNAPSD